MSHITAELQDRVLTLRFNRPDKKNALTRAMYSMLADELKKAQTDNEVRVVLLVGQPECFTSGNDLVDFLQDPPSSPDSPVGQFMQALATLEKPVIAAVSGIAVGVGVTLLLHCDLAYCGEQTKLNMPFVGLGLCPEFASTYLLPRMMGLQRATELLLLGEGFDAQKALAYGLVNAVVPNADVEALARQKAVAISKQPPKAVRVSKALLKRWSGATVNEAIHAEFSHFSPMLKQPEALEAMGAFMQKRKPDFSKFV